jgi:hypothetical protein
MFAADESRKLMLEPQEQRNPPRLCSDADLALMRAGEFYFTVIFYANLAHSLTRSP